MAWRHDGITGMKESCVGKAFNVGGNGKFVYLMVEPNKLNGVHV